MVEEQGRGPGITLGLPTVQCQEEREAGEQGPGVGTRGKHSKKEGMSRVAERK